MIEAVEEAVRVGADNATKGPDLASQSCWSGQTGAKPDRLLRFSPMPGREASIFTRTSIHTRLQARRSRQRSRPLCWMAMTLKSSPDCKTHRVSQPCDRQLSRRPWLAEPSRRLRLGWHSRWYHSGPSIRRTDANPDCCGPRPGPSCCASPCADYRAVAGQHDYLFHG